MSWYIDDNRLTIDGLPQQSIDALINAIPDDPPDWGYPGSFWRVFEQTSPINGLMTVRAIDSDLLEPPYPASFWYCDFDLNRLNLGLVAVPIDSDLLEYPYPASFWYCDLVENRDNNSVLPKEVPLGAFIGCDNLQEVKIARSLQTLGKWSFIETDLTSVTIPQNCTFFNTTFPEDCVIHYYDN